MIYRNGSSATNCLQHTTRSSNIMIRKLLYMIVVVNLRDDPTRVVNTSQWHEEVWRSRNQTLTNSVAHAKPYSCSIISGCRAECFGSNPHKCPLMHLPMGSISVLKSSAPLFTPTQLRDLGQQTLPTEIGGDLGHVDHTLLSSSKFSLIPPKLEDCIEMINARSLPLF